MSGSGGGSFRGFSSSFDCNALAINTHLASPKPSVIATLKKGQILQIELTSTTGPVEVKTEDGAIAGSILTSDLAQLIQCISDGHEYKAKVLDKNGGNCQVLITHK